MSNETETAEEAVPSVTQALAAIIGELPGIGKNHRLSLGGGKGYAFRGIEDITGPLKGLLAKHGVVFVPTIESWQTAPIGNMTEATCLVSYFVYGPAGDSIKIGPMLGVGRDSSDKAANKAMTAAWKYALVQTFCIADPADDGDQERLEVTPVPVQTKEQLESMLRVQEAGADQTPAERTELREWMASKEIPPTPSQWSVEQADLIVAMISEQVENRAENGGTE